MEVLAWHVYVTSYRAPSVCADALQDVCQSEGGFEHRAAGFGDFKAGLPLQPLHFRYIRISHQSGHLAPVMD